jgi:hypothetical protein
VIWLGGLITLGAVAAPLIFEILQARVPDAGRVLAGTVFGTVLGRFHLVSGACGLVMLLSLVVMALIGPRPRPYGGRLAIITVMLLCTAAMAWPVARGIARIQQEAGNMPVASLPAADPRRVTLKRLHDFASALMLANAAGGLLLVLWESRR